ncbi:MAG: hypothetical protein EPN22_04475 [Nitrospirae bacterium]|nr:MAG: hypothetical protein EPN22_04475 [Nitrospirota bacterium]
MIKRVVFVPQGKFTRRDYQRFGIELLRGNGFSVEIWDMTSFLYPEFATASAASNILDRSELIAFSDKKAACNRLSGLSESDFVIMLVPYMYESLWIYKALSKSSAAYAAYCANALPIFKDGVDGTAMKILHYLNTKPMALVKHLVMRLPFLFVGVKPVNLILAGGNKCLQYNYPTGRNTEILWVHSLDYDIYLQEKDKPDEKRNIAVFIDEFLPLHHEYSMFGIEPPIEAGKYYALLARFFDLVEKETGHEVVIAECPEANYEELPDYFKRRKRLKGQTANLVKQSKLVLGHYSTALSFANLFRKPVIFMTCADFYGKFEYYQIPEMAKWFGKKPVFIDSEDNIDWKFELTVSDEHYDRYRKAYIKTDDSQDLFFWQVVANKIKNWGTADGLLSRK